MSTITASTAFALVQSGEWTELDFALWLETEHGATRIDAARNALALVNAQGVEGLQDFVATIDRIWPQEEMV